MKNARKILTIRTPEGIVFPMTIAGPIARFVALVIDQVVIGLLSMFVNAVVKTLSSISFDLAMAGYTITAFLMSLGYPIVFEWYWRGQTVGKKVMHLQVIDEQGLRLRFSQVVIRNLLRLVDMLPALYLLGGAACFASAHGQRLGDLAANTIVVYHPSLSEPDLDQVMSGKYNSFRDQSYLAARLRQRSLPTEADIALRAIMRRDQMDDVSRLVLFEHIREHFERLAEFPVEITEGISDEQYVRNVVDILFR